MLDILSRTGAKIASLLNERTDYGVEMNSPTLYQLNDLLEKHSIADVLPYRSYDPAKQIFHNEGNVGFVIETHPLVGCSEEMQREISGLFQHTLPEETNIQFTLWG